MPKKIEISHRTIIFTVFFLLFLWLLYFLRGVLIIFFFSVILMAAFNPLVDRLQKWRIPRALSIILIYILIFGAFGFAIAGVIPPLVDQTQSLVSRFPSYLQSLRWTGFDENLIYSQLNQFTEKLGVISGGVIKIFVNVFSNVVDVVVLIVISFYLLLQRRNLDQYLLRFLGENGQKIGARIVDKIEKRLGGWVRAIVLLMIIVGLLDYIGLRLLGIEFALPLAIFAGMMEIIPTIGPFIATVLAIIAGLTVSPLTALAVGALFFLVQQLENSLIVPKLMEKEIGMNPVVTILALIAGIKLGGVMGAILAIPIVLLIEIIFTEVTSSDRFKKV